MHAFLLAVEARSVQARPCSACYHGSLGGAVKRAAPAAFLLQAPHTERASKHPTTAKMLCHAVPFRSGTWAGSPTMGTAPSITQRMARPPGLGRGVSPSMASCECRRPMQSSMPSWSRGHDYLLAYHECRPKQGSMASELCKPTSSLWFPPCELLAATLRAI